MPRLESDARAPSSGVRRTLPQNLVSGRAAQQISCAMEVNTQNALTTAGHVEVEIQTIFALVGEQRRQSSDLVQPPRRHQLQGCRFISKVRQPLRANSTKLFCRPNATPLNRRFRETITRAARRRRCIRNAQERLHHLHLPRVGLDEDAAHLPEPATRENRNSVKRDFHSHTILKIHADEESFGFSTHT